MAGVKRKLGSGLKELG